MSLKNVKINILAIMWFLNSNEQVLKSYEKIINQINQLEDTIQTLSNEELRYKTIYFKEKLKDGYTIDKILPEAFAVVRETSRRLLGLRHFDVQLLGGIILHMGKVAEMKTGEGKTLVSTLPAYLNALTGKGVHIITVNEYLARRDCEWVGQIHRFLGLEVGLIQNDMDQTQRRNNYECDITYSTNSEIGFDYLRDHMAFDRTELVHRGFSFCIIDEVDSILIDEARTPLIISGASEVPVEKYQKTAEVVGNLQKGVDYEVDEKARNVTFTERGLRLCEQLLGIDDLYNITDAWAPYILNALKAKELFIKDIHYIVRDEAIVIVDEFTGRIMPERRWSDGLHQAIEAKEQLEIKQETETLASITYQNFFLLYEKISGMTGTAKTEEAELDRIYGLEVIVIPTHKPMIRKDFPDLVYRTEYAKWKGVASECYDMYCMKRPTLVGTTSIEKSELLSELLKQLSIPHKLLNAKPENVERESEIIAQAGRKGAITIATNMAGRGTDIILGGSAEAIVRFQLASLIEECLLLVMESASPEVGKETLALGLEIFSSKVITALIDIVSSLIDSEEIELQNNSLIRAKVEEKVYIASDRMNPEDLILQNLKTLYHIFLESITPILENEKGDVINAGGLHVVGTERHESRRIDNQLRGRSGRQGDPGSSRFFLSLEDNLLRVFGGERISKLMESLKVEEDTPIESSWLNRSLENAQKKVESYFYDIRKQVFDYDEIVNAHRQILYAERQKIVTTDYCRDLIISFAKTTIDEVVTGYQQLIEKGKLTQAIKLFKNIEELLGLPRQLNLEKFNQLTTLQQKHFLYEQILITYELKEIELELISSGLSRQLEKYYLLEQIDTTWREHIKIMNHLRDISVLRGYAQEDPLMAYKNEGFLTFLLTARKIRQRTIYSLVRSSTGENE